MAETRYARCPLCKRVLSDPTGDDRLCPFCLDRKRRPEPVAVVPIAEWEAAVRLKEAAPKALNALVYALRVIEGEWPSAWADGSEAIAWLRAALGERAEAAE